MSSSFSMADAWAKMGSNPTFNHPTVESVCNAPTPRTKIERIALPILFPIEKDKLPNFVKESQRILREGKEKYKEKFIQNQNPASKKIIDSLPQECCRHHYEQAQEEKDLDVIFAHYYRMINAIDSDQALCREVFFKLFETAINPSEEKSNLLCCLGMCAIGQLNAEDATYCSKRMNAYPLNGLSKQSHSQEVASYESFCNAFSSLIESGSDEGIKILEQLMRDPTFRDIALQLVLVHKRNRSDFAAIEKILTDHVDIQPSLSSDTKLLMLDLQFQLLLRQGLFQEAEKVLNDYRAFPQANSLRLARQAQIMIRQYKPGNNLAPAFIALNACWNIATTRDPLLPWFFHFEIGVIKIEFLWLVGDKREAAVLYSDYFSTSTDSERAFAAECKDALSFDLEEQKNTLKYYEENHYPSHCPELLSQVLDLYDRAAPEKIERILETAHTLLILEWNTVVRYKAKAHFYVWKYSQGSKDHYANEQKLIACLLNDPGPDSNWIVNYYFYGCVDAGKAKHAIEFCKKWLSKFHYIPEVFIQLAKQASMKKDQMSAVIEMFKEILFEQNAALSPSSRSDLFHALGYLTGLTTSHAEAMRYLELSHPDVNGVVNMTLGGYFTHLKQFEESIKAFERGFFSMWLKANYKSFFYDSSIDWVNEVYVRMYVKHVFHMHRQDERRVIEHLNQFLDTMPIQTEWKRCFVHFLIKEVENQVSQMESAKKGKGGKAEKVSHHIPKGHADFSNKLVYQEIKKLFIDQVTLYYQELLSRYSKENGIEPTDVDCHLLIKEALALTEPKGILRKLVQVKISRDFTDNETLKKAFRSLLKHLYKQSKEYQLDKDVAIILMILSDNQYSDLIEGSDIHFIAEAHKFCLADQPDRMKQSLESTNSKSPIVNLGLAVAHFAYDEESDPIVTVYLKRLLEVKHLSNQAALYLLTWYKDRGNLIEIERFLTSERQAGIERDDDFKVLSRDLWFQIEYSKGNFEKVVELVQEALLKEPNDPFLSARLAFLSTAHFVQGSSIIVPFKLLQQAEINYKNKKYPACLVYEFDLMRMFFYINLNMTQQACELAKHARQYSSYPVKTFIPELQRVADTLAQGAILSSQEMDKIQPLISHCFLEESFIPQYTLHACFILMLSKRTNRESVLSANSLSIKYTHSPMSKAYKSSFAFIKWWSSFVLHKKECPEEFSELRIALLDSRTPKLIYDYFIVHTNSSAVDVPQQLLREWLVKFGATTPRIFTYFAQGLKREGLTAQVLTVYKTLESSFAKNIDLLYAMALLTDGATRDAYLEKCINADPENVFQYPLVALKASKDKAPDAHQYLEKYYRVEYQKTCYDSFWTGVQFTTEQDKTVPVYLELLSKKYPSEQEVAAHVEQLFSEFRTPSGWLSRFKQAVDVALADRLKKQNRPRKERKTEDRAKMEEKIRQGREAFLKEQEESYRRLMQQEHERQRKMEEENKPVAQAAQPIVSQIAQDEIDNRQRLMARRAVEKEELRQMLNAGQNALPKRSRFTLENALKMADDLAKESRRNPNPEAVMVLQPKVRERYIPTGQSEIVLPIATTVLTPANPAAAPRVYHQDVFSIVTDHENARLRQAYTCLSNMEGILQRAGKHEYPPELHDFIIQRALMYQLLRLGECLFPQSAAVRKNLSQNYQITMEKIVGREMLAMIRNQLRHEFRNVTLPRVLRVCEELLKSNLKKNIQTWHEYSIKPQNVSAAVKTSLPESCQVIEGMASVPSLGFLMGELKKLGALLDKIGDDVLAMNPDLVATVKMSVCILGEMAKTERRIQGLDQFIEPSNKVAHEFGEDCEFYTTDEVSLFNIKPYVAMAKNIYKDFCK